MPSRGLLLPPIRSHNRPDAAVGQNGLEWTVAEVTHHEEAKVDAVCSCGAITIVNMKLPSIDFHRSQEQGCVRIEYSKITVKVKM